MLIGTEKFHAGDRKIFFDKPGCAAFGTSVDLGNNGEGASGL
jgi:hypothetical protein